MHGVENTPTPPSAYRVNKHVFCVADEKKLSISKSVDAFSLLKHINVLITFCCRQHFFQQFLVNNFDDTRPDFASTDKRSSTKKVVDYILPRLSTALELYRVVDNVAAIWEHTVANVSAKIYLGTVQNLLCTGPVQNAVVQVLFSKDIGGVITFFYLFSGVNTCIVSSKQNLAGQILFCVTPASQYTLLTGQPLTLPWGGGGGMPPSDFSFATPIVTNRG